MDAQAKKRLLLIGAGIVGIAILAGRTVKAAATPDPESGIVDGLNIPGLAYSGGKYDNANAPDYQYGGGGSNMYFEGARNTWPAMQTMMPISIGGSTYSTGDMFSQNQNQFTMGDTSLNISGNGKDCCCEDPANPTQTVSAAVIIANSKPPKTPFQGYAFMNPDSPYYTYGYMPSGLGIPGMGSRGW